MKQHLRVSRGLLTAAAFAALILTTAPPAAALEGYTNGRLSVVSEPDAPPSPYVAYYDGGEEKALSELTWTDEGRSGKAVALDGKSQYLQVGDTMQLSSPQLSFATWMYWKGPVEGVDSSFHAQRLFTMTNRRGTSWVSLAPHARDDSAPDEEGRILDGVYLDFYKDGGDGLKIQLFNPAVQDSESYGIPLNEWHHVALVFTAEELLVYLDGRVWFRQGLLMGANELLSSRFIIGNGSLWEGGMFHGLIDDAALYDFALSADQVRMLAGGVDPLAEGAALPAPAEPYLPTAPSYTTAPPSATATTAAGTGTLMGLPYWGVYTLGGLIVVFVGLTAVSNVYENRRRRPPGEDDPPDETAEDPVGEAAGEAADEGADRPVEAPADEAAGGSAGEADAGSAGEERNAKEKGEEDQ
ncbi:MAG: LamG domain-containing protein [Clostridiales bacterium]|nr:LamG domain-containing protein [Clostridiales bacterium]